jgi:hypothetical protein
MWDQSVAHENQNLVRKGQHLATYRISNEHNLVPITAD